MKIADHAGTGTIVDISDYLSIFRNEEIWRHQNRKTVVLYEGPQSRVLLSLMRAGEVFSPFLAPHPVIIQMLQGSLRVNTESDPLFLHKGQLLVLEPGVEHSIEFLKNSAILLTVPTGQVHPAER